MHLPLAFSIHHFISSVGADAGFAAIIGLAILVLLYFAQARETTTLRDEAIAASQRVEQLERRVAAIGVPTVAPPPGATATDPGAGAQTGAAQPSGQATGGEQAPGAAPPGVGVSPAARGVAARPLASPAASAAVPERSGTAAERGPLPTAPAGVGAPAVIDATRLIPVPTAQPGSQGAGGQASSAEQARAAGGEEAAARAAPDEQSAQGQRADAAQPAKSPQTAATAVATPPPATAAAAGQAGEAPSQPGATSTAAGQPAPVAANGTGDQAQVQARGGKPLPPQFQLRPEAAGFSGSISGGERGQAARWFSALAGVLLLAAVVAVLLVVTSTGSTHHHAAVTSSRNPSAARGSRAGFLPRSVTVAVLNGTDVSQLAHRVAQKLARAGYRQGTVATAADQTHTSTIVAFLPGFRSDASYVAGSLGLTTSAIQPADPSAQAIACPPPATCRANVIVTVGSDLNSIR